MLKFYRDREHKHRWKIKSPNNSIVADSGQGYASLRNCQEGVAATLRALVERGPTYFTDMQGEWRWHLQAANNEIVADSGEGYFNKKDCKDGFVLAMQDVAKFVAQELD